MNPDAVSMLVPIALLVFVLAVYTIGSHRFFQWSWRKSFGMSMVLKIASLIVSAMVTNALSFVLPHAWFWFHSAILHDTLIFVGFASLRFAVRATTEWAICRYATVPVGMMRTLGIVAAMYAVVSLPTDIADYCLSRPAFAPPFSLAPRADWLGGGTPLVFYSPRQRCLVRSTLGTTNEMFVSTALPDSGYRISADATRIVVCDSSSSVVFAHAPCTTGAVRELSVQFPFPRPAYAALSTDARWCAVIDGKDVRVFSFPDGAPTATVHVASIASKSFLAWSTDTSVLFCGTTAAVFSVDWRTGQSTVHTQALDNADVNWAFDYTCLALTSSFCRGDIAITNHATKGISVASHALAGSFRPTTPSVCVGIGISPDSSSYIFYFSFLKPIVEILALNLRTGAIGHLYEGGCLLMPGAGVRIPPAPPVQ